MDIARKARHILTCGNSGSGKTTFAMRYITGADFYDRIYVYDHEGEFSERSGITPARSESELEDFFTEFRFIIFEPSEMFGSPDSENDLEGGLDWFCRWLFNKQIEHDIESLFYVDEMQKIQSQLTKVSPALKSIYQTGRRRRIDTLTVTQAPNLIHNAIRSQATDLAVFRLKESNALKFLDDLGYNLPGVETLQDLDYYYINAKFGDVEKKTLTI